MDRKKLNCPSCGQLTAQMKEDSSIWYYAHEQDKVKRLCNDMTELLEKKLARYLNERG